MPIGMTRSQMIDTAHRRTEGRAKSLDSNAEFAMALQEVALDARWWWRRKIATFTIKAGVSTYEFAGTGSLALEDFQQAPRDGFKIFLSSKEIGDVNPVFSLDIQQVIAAFQTTQPAGRPTQYFIVGAPGQMRVDPVPDRDYLASLAYWSIPIYVPGGEAGEQETIPSIPAYFHPLLLKKVELHFLAFSLGEDSLKYKVGAAEYGELRNNVNLYNNFAEGEVRSLASDNRDDSVRSS